MPARGDLRGTWPGGAGERNQTDPGGFARTTTTTRICLSTSILRRMTRAKVLSRLTSSGSDAPNGEMAVNETPSEGGPPPLKNTLNLVQLNHTRMLATKMQKTPLTRTKRGGNNYTKRTGRG